MDQNTLSLKVLEAYTRDVGRDVGRGVARIDYDSMDNLGASTGDVVEIKGKRRTVAKCLPLYPSDEGKGIIKIDDLVRNNSGVAIGDTVVVKKIKAVPAEKVIVAPLEAIPSIDERYLADALESVPLIKGDNVMVPYFGGRLTFQVRGVNPAADAVLVNQKTIFQIAEMVAITEQCIRGITLRMEDGIRKESGKTFLKIKFHLSYINSTESGEIEVEVKNDLQRILKQYESTAKDFLENIKEQLINKLKESKTVEINLIDIKHGIYEKLRTMDDT